VTDAITGLRLAVAGGGTGGHVHPAIAVIDELRRRGQLVDPLWIGSHDGVERHLSERHGISFASIPTGKFRRYLSVQNLTDAVRVPIGIAVARRRLREFRPDVILSTGGFVSVPTVIAARGIAPVVTHDQTAILGLATRINARFADVLALSFSQTETEARALHRQVVVTGNPVRAEIARGDTGRGRTRFGFDESLPLVYVTGGARGASPINRRIAELIPALLEHAQVLHQTGPASANADARELATRHAALPAALRSRYQVVEFLGTELPDVYAAADLIVGRAGAGTVAELAAVGKPSILIPLPGAGRDEQTENARVLLDAGAAIVIRQEEATPARLRDEIIALIHDPERRGRMAAAARAVARPDAAARLADAVIATAQRGDATRR
jgi:UDP-N-acetylglucosamine--N-acetylmuramyl-(pentapeptide) pyrophosphoryl-undecaprenol N-acetylglucosamine transferase